MHHFIFTPGVFEGEGKITFSMADDVLNFKTEWIFLPEEDNRYFFSQEIDIDGFPEKMRNHFTLWLVSDKEFEIKLENNIVGSVMGSGLITPTRIAWEFRRKDQEFEGFEFYELQADGAYKMRAEFTAGEGMFTHITGTLSARV